MYPANLKSANMLFWLCNSLGLLFSALALYWLFPVGGAIDHWLITPWVAADGSFPLRQNWWLTSVAHEMVKYVIIALVVVFITQFFASFYRPKWQHYRWTSGYILLAMLISSSLIGVLKANSVHACPWNLTQPTAAGFVWLSHLDKPGKCFPGGHSAAGFSLIALFFAYLGEKGRRAYFYLAAGIILGFGMGWTQMMRGAHFLSHNLWTLWFTWLVNLSLMAIAELWVLRKKWLVKPRYIHPDVQRGIQTGIQPATLLPLAKGNIIVTDNPPNRVE